MGHKISQKRKVLNYLLIHGSIYSMESINEIYNTRLAASICDLKEDGYHIEAVPIINSQFVRYFLRDEPVITNQLELF